MNDARPSPRTPQRPSLRWLAIGAVAGLVAAAWGLLERAPGDTPLPATAVAQINGRVIDVDRYDRAVESLRAALGRDPDDADKARLLTQLVDEELLVQRGVELGMAESETTVRAAIVQSLIASVTAEADAADPTDGELQEFLTANAERYTYATALSVDAWIAEDEWVARDFVGRLRNGDDVSGHDDVQRVSGLPATPIPIERLRMFVGPGIAASAAEMPEGASGVYARQGRWYVVRVRGHEAAVLGSLDTIRSQVLIDYRRALADDRLREYLDGLRSRSDVTVVAP